MRRKRKREMKSNVKSIDGYRQKQTLYMLKRSKILLALLWGSTDEALGGGV